MRTVIKALGWYGVLAVLGAYAASSLGYLDAQSTTYYLLNLTGALGIVLETRAKKDYQPMILNIAWLAVAIVGLLGI